MLFSVSSYTLICCDILNGEFCFVFGVLKSSLLKIDSGYVSSSFFPP